jgi:hypothetical protein
VSSEIVDIQISDLLLDVENPRYTDVARNQQAAASALAEKHSSHILKLAEDIVENGLDPTTLPAVVATSDKRKKRYRLLEGNRRLLAIKALETPTLISAVFSSSASKRLTSLSKQYAKKPLSSMKCVLFSSEKEAEHWVWLRHTGENEGIGLVGWGAKEKERYKARHTGKLKPTGQVIEFVEKYGNLSPEAQASNQKITTNVERLIETTYVRQKLGFDVIDGDVVSWYPRDEVVKGLTRIVDDLLTKKLSVKDLYYADQRKQYVDGFTRRYIPKKSTMLDQPVVLSDLTAGKKKPRKIQATPKPTPKTKPRTTVAKDGLDVSTPRINDVYNELLTLNAESYTNACAVLLRVFVELSVDHFLEEKKVMPEKKIEEEPLKVRMKAVGKHLKKNGDISNTLLKAVNSMADSQSVLAPGLTTFNQYVHNKYTFPKPSELYASWDELAPFLQKIWP